MIVTAPRRKASGMVGCAAPGMRFIRFAIFCGRDVAGHVETGRSWMCTLSERYQQLKRRVASDKSPGCGRGCLQRMCRFVVATRSLEQIARSIMESANPELARTLCAIHVEDAVRCLMGSSVSVKTTARRMARRQAGDPE